jgi:hypothetical protein
MGRWYAIIALIVFASPASATTVRIGLGYAATIVPNNDLTLLAPQGERLGSPYRLLSASIGDGEEPLSWSFATSGYSYTVIQGGDDAKPSLARLTGCTPFHTLVSSSFTQREGMSAAAMFRMQVNVYSVFLNYRIVRTDVIEVLVSGGLGIASHTFSGSPFTRDSGKAFPLIFATPSSRDLKQRRYAPAIGAEIYLPMKLASFGLFGTARKSFVSVKVPTASRIQTGPLSIETGVYYQLGS